MRALAALLAALVLSACTPAQALHLTFGQEGPAVEAQARRVATCESGDGIHFESVNPGAVSPTNDHGMMQINRRWHERAFTSVTGRPWSDVYDPFWNAVYARHLWRSTGGNWQHWTCKP